jgi:hypothetical protein
LGFFPKVPFQTVCERIVESVIHMAKVYALFLARWCGIAE